MGNQKIIYTYDSFYPYNRDGGPNYSCKNTVELLAKNGIPVKVLTSKGSPGFQLDKSEIEHGIEYFRKLGVEIEYIGTSKRSNLKLPLKVFSEARSNIIHLNGMWSTYLLSGVFSNFLFNNTKLLISPRGMLMPGSFKQGKNLLKKRIFSLLKSQFFKCYWQVSSKIEKNELEKLGFSQHKIFYIPNPIKLTNLIKANEPRKGFYFVGRLAPVKGLDLMLSSYNQAIKTNPNLDDLFIIGSEYKLKFSDIIKSFSENLKSKVHFLNEITGIEKNRIIQKARATVNTSHSENFGMSIAESLELGTPVIACEGSPWQEIGHYKCGIFCKRNIDEISQAFLDFQAMSSNKIEAFGKNGRLWMHHSFSEELIGQNFTEMYKTIRKDSQISWNEA